MCCEVKIRNLIAYRTKLNVEATSGTQKLHGY